ncbi:MAG: glycoside hydrolase family 2 TIM barrel-domain containing protein [Phycisphaerae bacterium]
MSNLTAFCLVLYLLLAVPAFAAADRGGAAAGAVKVEIRKDGGRFRLYRGGRAYYIKGAVYWADPRGRFPLSGLAACGGNSVRCGGGNVSRILDEAARLGVSATVGLPMRMEAVHKFDYSDPAAVAQQLERMKAMVMKYKDHPAVLMWGIGNELSMSYTDRKVWDAVNDVAEFIHKVDPHHPTMTVIGGGKKLAEAADIRRQCPAIDVLGVNYYKGLQTVPERVRQAGWDKPYCITEWGPSGHWQVPKTQWRAAIEETSTEKAARYRQRYEETMLKDTERCLGSYVFMWGSKQEQTHTWYGMFLSSGERTEAVNVMQYLWTGKWPANRAPRIASLSIDGKAPSDSVYLKPKTSHAAEVGAAAPDGDALSFRWDVLPEPTKFGYGGMGERKPKAVAGLIKEGAAGKVTFATPGKEGAYRLFVAVLDGRGNAAAANIPFCVRP